MLQIIDGKRMTYTIYDKFETMIQNIMMMIIQKYRILNMI